MAGLGWSREDEMKTGILQTLRLKNFKAIRDSGLITFTPLTAFIGNNGSGKSSIVEGLETLQQITQEDLDLAMEQSRGFENAWYQGVKHEVLVSKHSREQEGGGRWPDGLFSASR